MRAEMDQHLQQLHLHAGKICGRDATCGPPERPKGKHETYEAAAKAAASLNRSGKARNTVEPYPCAWCSSWHIGREMSAQELVELSQMKED